MGLFSSLRSTAGNDRSRLSLPAIPLHLLGPSDPFNVFDRLHSDRLVLACILCEIHEHSSSHNLFINAVLPGTD